MKQKKWRLSYLFLASLLLSSCGTQTAGEIPENGNVSETESGTEVIPEPDVVTEAVSEQPPVRIAILDSGISAIAINSTSLEGGLNGIRPFSDTEDTVGHGTAAASIIVGSEKAKQEGICPEAVLIPLVYCEEDYLGRTVNADTETVGELIREAVDTFHCDILNISSASAKDDSSLRSAVEYAVGQGVVVVACAGNTNLTTPDNIYYPAAYDGVICVGSVNGEGEVSDFSQRGNFLDFVAPGEELPAATTGGELTTVTGTSFSAAYVTGIIANILIDNPNLREQSEEIPQKVTEFLKQRAIDLGDPGWDADFGWGVLMENH